MQYNRFPLQKCNKYPLADIRQHSKKMSFFRLSTDTVIFAGQIHHDDVKLLFNPEFLNCPGTTAKPDKIGNKIVGSSADNVLDRIIHQLNPSFSIKDVQEFNKIYDERVPEVNRTELQSVVHVLDIVLKDLKIDGAQTDIQIAAYKQALLNIMSYTRTCRLTSKDPLKLVFGLERLLDELSGSCTYTVPHSSSLRQSMTNYWTQLFTCISPIDTFYDGNGPIHYRNVHFQGNGACLFKFEIKVSDDYLFRACTDMDEVQKTPKGDCSTDDDDMSNSQKTFLAQPDLTAFLKLEEMSERNLSTPDLQRLFFIAQMKTPQRMPKRQLSESDSSSDDSSDQQRKSSKTKHKDDQVIATGIRSHHFLELLCAMKYGNNNISEMNKCYGMYCVGHRFYITCLSVASKYGQDTMAIKSMKQRFMFLAESPEDFRNNEHIELKLACTDYLDMFNPVHVEAMLKFMAVLISHEA